MLSALVLAAMTAQSGALPVQVASCEISQTVAPQSGDAGGFEAIGRDQLHVRFTDLAAQPIKNVVFALNDGTTVADAGTFPPNVPIDHTLEITGGHATACAVQSVLLADGTQLAVAPSALLWF